MLGVSRADGALSSAADQISALAVGDPSVGPVSVTYHVGRTRRNRSASKVFPRRAAGAGRRRFSMARCHQGRCSRPTSVLSVASNTRSSSRSRSMACECISFRWATGRFATLPDNATEILHAVEGRMAVRVTAKAGPRVIGATFSEDERPGLPHAGVPAKQCRFHRSHRVAPRQSITITGPSTQPVRRHAEPPPIQLPPGQPRRREGLRNDDHSTLARRPTAAPSRPPT